MAQHLAPARTTIPGRAFTAAGTAFGMLKLVLAPVMLGPAGAIVVLVGQSEGDRPWGTCVAVVSLAATVLGLGLGPASMTSMGRPVLLRPA